MMEHFDFGDWVRLFQIPYGACAFSEIVLVSKALSTSFL